MPFKSQESINSSEVYPEDFIEFKDKQFTEDKEDRQDSEKVYHDFGMETLPPKEKTNTSVEKEQLFFEKADNFDQLFGLIKEKGKILGSDGSVYYADEIIGYVNSLRHFPGIQNDVTRTEGLRVKVEELLKKEPSHSSEEEIRDYFEKSVKNKPVLELDKNDLVRIGQKVPIKRSNGQIEDVNWYVDGYNPVNKTYFVIKKDKEGNLQKPNISVQDLRQWSQEAGWNMRRV